MKTFFEKLYKNTQSEFFSLAEQHLVNNERMFVVTANPEIFMQADENPEYARMLLDADTTLIADGIGIVKGAGMLKIPVKERIPGVELSEFLLSACARLGKSVYLFGAKREVLDTLCTVLSKKYPSLSIVGSSDGYAEDKDAVFDEIAKLCPDVILVALGVPQQETLIYRHLKKFNKGIFVGVGGSFDVLSGMKARAPKFFIRMNLEWLYRILKEPSRFKRFYQNNVKFIFRVKKLKKG
jgi:N-acetylglucosaminyldiphosphoundecaprenol N-acetyl-beta-D-mannosaminyltransferase